MVEAHSFQLSRSRRRVLVVMTDHHLGNTVIALPVIDALARSFDRPIDVLVDARYAELVALLPRPLTIVAYPSQAPKRRGVARNLRPLLLALRVFARRYGVVINLCDGSRAWGLVLASLARRRIGFAEHRCPWIYSHTESNAEATHWYAKYASILRCIGAEGDLRWPLLKAPDEAHRRVRAEVEAALPEAAGPLAVIHPGAGRAGRRWPPEQFAIVADELVGAYGMRICVIGTPSERPVMNQLRLAMTRREAACCLSLPLVRLLALFEQAALVVSNESGPTHLAATTAVPIVTIFGPAREEAWRPVRREQVVLVRGAECDPRCGKRRCFADQRCMERTTPEMVMAAARAVIGTPVAPTARIR